MLVFVNSPVPLDLFQKPSLHSSIVKSLSDKEKFFSSGFPPNNSMTGKYMVDKWVVTIAFSPGRKSDGFHLCGAGSELTRETDIIHYSKGKHYWGFCS